MVGRNKSFSSSGRTKRPKSVLAFDSERYAVKQSLTHEGVVYEERFAEDENGVPFLYRVRITPVRSKK